MPSFDMTDDEWNSIIKAFQYKDNDLLNFASDIKIDIDPNDFVRMYDSAKWMYEHLLEIGVCPEQARMVLPQSMMTEWYWSGTLYAFARVCNLRCKDDAQKETQMVAKQIDVLTEEIFPYSWEALRDG